MGKEDPSLARRRTARTRSRRGGGCRRWRAERPHGFRRSRCSMSRRLLSERPLGLPDARFVGAHVPASGSAASRSASSSLSAATSSTIRSSTALCELCDRRAREDRLQRQVDLELVADPQRDLHGAERRASELEEAGAAPPRGRRAARRARSPRCAPRRALRRDVSRRHGAASMTARAAAQRRFVHLAVRRERQRVEADEVLRDRAAAGSVSARWRRSSASGTSRDAT